MRIKAPVSARVQLAAISIFLLWPLPAGTAASSTDSSTPRSWQILLSWLETQRDQMSADLEEAHAFLYARANDENPDLAERLSLEPPRPLPWGCGIVPELKENGPFDKIEILESTFSLEQVSSGYSNNMRHAAFLAGRAAADPTLSLEWTVPEFERLRDRMRLLEKQVSCHRFWQPDVVRARNWYNGRNKIIGLVRERQELHETGNDPGHMRVLTTGAKSLDVPGGRTIQLGSTSVTPRTLAHKFGHLLGFKDSYVRGYEGEPESTIGVSLIELTGLYRNLMDAPGKGRVTVAMIDQLIEAYEPVGLLSAEKTTAVDYLNLSVAYCDEGRFEEAIEARVVALTTDQKVSLDLSETLSRRARRCGNLRPHDAFVTAKK